MDLAAKILENQGFVDTFLHKSQATLAKNRELAEDLLNRAGIQYHKQG